MRKTSLLLVGAAIGGALTIVATQPILVGSDADAKTVTKPDIYRLLNMFGDAFEQVRSHYVERPNDGKLVQTAINGMLADLEDSYFIDPQALARSDACTGPRCATAFGNIGVAYTIQEGLATVVTPDRRHAGGQGRRHDRRYHRPRRRRAGPGPHLPAVRHQAGRRRRLDGQADHGARRPRQADRGVDRPRQHHARSVRGRGEGGDIGYIRIIQFNEATADQLKKAIDDIAAQIPAEKLKGYVIDLRNNPGGTLDGAIAAADGFLDDGEIVSIRHRASDKVERFRAKAGDLANGKPIVVLINGGSAAKAEIVAGALKDNHRATVVGTRSFGEGWDSTTVPLGPNKGALRLATGHYITPSGRLIQSNGIVPDVEAPQDVPDDLKVKAHGQNQGQGPAGVAVLHPARSERRQGADRGVCAVAQERGRRARALESTDFKKKTASAARSPTCLRD